MAWVCAPASEVAEIEGVADRLGGGMEVVVDRQEIRDRSKAVVGK